MKVTVDCFVFFGINKKKDNSLVAKKKMVWSTSMDELLCKEIILYEPYQFKARTKESGNGWKLIGESLSSSDTFKFNVDSSSCRERFSLLKS